MINYLIKEGSPGMKRKRNNYNNLIKSAINYKALHDALKDPEKAKELKKIFDKVRY